MLIVSVLSILARGAENILTDPDVAGVGHRIPVLVPPSILSWLERHLAKKAFCVHSYMFCVLGVCAVLRVSVARGPRLSANIGEADETSRWVYREHDIKAVGGNAKNG